MAICSGCTGGDTLCHCALQLGGGSTGLTLTGTGATGDPWILTGSGGGGGGTCNQRTYYTVASVGPAGFGGLAATPAPFQACADFLGDGTTDNVALQAAIDLSAASPTFVPVPVYINVGYYILAASIDTKAIRIIGASQGGTILSTNLIIGGPGGTRLIDNTASGGAVVIEQVTFNAGGAAAIFCGGVIHIVQVYDCAITAFSDSGVDGAFIYVNGAGNCIIDRNIFQIATSSGVHDGIHMLSGFIPAPRIVNNFFSGAGVRLDDMSAVMMQGNVFANIYTAGGPGSPIYTIGLFATCRYNHINNNTIFSCQHEAIVIDATAGGSQAIQNQVLGNQILNYASSGSLVEDAIHLLGNADENQLQQNFVRAFGFGGRNGINISAATCNDNFVTNNDLFNSGAGASINDAGTATVLAAGNRL